MSDNPQEFESPKNFEPDEDGEIGWPAGAPAPYDPSIPEPGSGGVGPHAPGEISPAVLDEEEEPEMPVAEVVVEAHDPVFTNEPQEESAAEPDVE